MTWGAIGGAAASAVVGGMMSDGGGGGGAGSTQTISKDPWSAADPWLRQQITTGQGLQGYYQSNPFNAQQQKAYGLLSQGNDYVNQLVPSLLSQISNQPSFNRANPSARPAPINFNTPGLGFGAPTGAGGTAGGSYNVDMNKVNNPFANGGVVAPAPAPASVQATPQLYPIYDGQYIIDYTYNPDKAHYGGGGH